MIDQVSNLGYAQVSAPATITTNGAGSGILNLLLGPGGASFVNSPSNGQPQGTIAFVLDATAVTGNGTYTGYVQTGTDNTNWTNVVNPATNTIFQFGLVSSTANTAGVQAIFVDSAYLSQYSRVLDVVTATVSTVRTITAVFVPKNP